jgi:hypothetical protein
MSVTAPLKPAAAPASTAAVASPPAAVPAPSFKTLYSKELTKLLSQLVFLR